MEAYTGMSATAYDKLCATTEGQNDLDRERLAHARGLGVTLDKVYWYKAHGKVWVGVNWGRPKRVFKHKQKSVLG